MIAQAVELNRNSGVTNLVHSFKLASPNRGGVRAEGKQRSMALQVEIDGAVATVTIDHPPTNLVDGAFFVELLDTFGRLEADESVRVVVFRSADPDFFLMHGDVHMLRDLAPPYVPATEPNIAAATFTRLRTGRLVTIGLLDGIARRRRLRTAVRTRPPIRFGAQRRRPTRGRARHSGRRRWDGALGAHRRSWAGARHPADRS